MSSPESRNIHRRTDEQAPLSSSQRRIWVFEQFAPGTPVYNRPANLRLLGDLHVDALQLSLNTVIDRHEVLRAKFHEVDGQIMQSVGEPTNLILESIDLRTWPEAEREFETERLIHNE